MIDEGNEEGEGKDKDDEEMVECEFVKCVLFVYFRFIHTQTVGTIFTLQYQYILVLLSPRHDALSS